MVNLAAAGMISFRARRRFFQSGQFPVCAVQLPSAIEVVPLDLAKLAGFGLGRV
jgi:hypothetical protein